MTNCHKCDKTEFVYRRKAWVTIVAIILAFTGVGLLFLPLLFLAPKKLRCVGCKNYIEIAKDNAAEKESKGPVVSKLWNSWLNRPPPPENVLLVKKPWAKRPVGIAVLVSVAFWIIATVLSAVFEEPEDSSLVNTSTPTVISASVPSTTLPTPNTSTLVTTIPPTTTAPTTTLLTRATTSSTTTTQTTTIPTTTTSTTTTSTSTTTTTTSTTTTTKPLARQAGNGTYRVGVDIEPGIYFANGKGDDCYFKISPNALGKIESLGDVHRGLAYRYRVELSRGDFFDSENCGTWSLERPGYFDGNTPTTIRANGAYLIGDGTPAGTYITNDALPFCFYQIYSDIPGRPHRVLGEYLGPARGQSISLNQGDFFITETCGDWELAASN